MLKFARQRVRNRQAREYHESALHAQARLARRKAAARLPHSKKLLCRELQTFFEL